MKTCFVSFVGDEAITVVSWKLTDIEYFWKELNQYRMDVDALINFDFSVSIDRNGWCIFKIVFMTNFVSVFL